MRLPRKYLETFFSSASFVDKIHRHDNIRAHFRIYNISVPELLYKIYSPKENFQDYLRRIIILCLNITKSIDELRSHRTKSPERHQTMFNYMVAQLWFVKMSTLDDRLLLIQQLMPARLQLIPTRNILMINWRNLGSQLTSYTWTSPSHRRGIKLRSILWLPRFELSRCQVYMTGSYSCKLQLIPKSLLLIPIRKFLMIKWRNLERYLTRSLKMSTIYSIRIKFPPRTMMLKMMEFRKSPSQHPKPSLPSLTHPFFKNQHSWPRCLIYTNSCPYHGRFLRQQVSMVFLKINFDNQPVNLQKQHPQVQNVMPSKLDTDGQGSQLTTIQHLQAYNPIQIIKVESCHQTMPQPCQIVTQSTSENGIYKSKTSHLWNLTQMIKVGSCHRLMTQPWQIVTT